MKTVAEYKEKKQKEQRLKGLCLALSECPAIDSTIDLPVEKVKLFAEIRCFYSFWTWYIAEIDPSNGLCYGYALGMEDEWGYFSRSKILEFNTLEYRLIDPAKTIEDVLAESPQCVTPCFSYSLVDGDSEILTMLDGFFTAESIRNTFIDIIRSGRDLRLNSGVSGAFLARTRVRNRCK